MPRGSAPGERRGGRQKGTPNRITADIKAAILGAFAKVGGEDYLALQAHENPQAFMTLLGKVLPTQVSNCEDGAFRVVVETNVNRTLDR